MEKDENAKPVIFLKDHQLAPQEEPVPSEGPSRTVDEMIADAPKRRRLTKRKPE